MESITLYKKLLDRKEVGGEVAARKLKVMKLSHYQNLSMTLMWLGAI